MGNVGGEFRQLSGTDLPANGDARGYPVGQDNPPWQRERPDGNAVRPLRGYAASRSSSATGTCATTACPSSASAGRTAALAGASGSGSSGRSCSAIHCARSAAFTVATPPRDRKSVVSGKRVSVRVELGGRRIIKNKQNTQTNQ